MIEMCKFIKWISPIKAKFSLCHLMHSICSLFSLPQEQWHMATQYTHKERKFLTMDKCIPQQTPVEDPVKTMAEAHQNFFSENCIHVYIYKAMIRSKLNN